MPEEKKFDLSKAWVILTERTQDPLMPIKLQNLHKWATAVGKALTPCSSIGETQAFTDRLLKDFGEEGEVVGAGAIIAMCALLVEALVILLRRSGFYRFEGEHP